MIEFFLENPPIGSKIYRFMMKNSLSGQVDFETFLFICKNNSNLILKRDKFKLFLLSPQGEVLLKDPDNNFFNQYKTVDKTEIFALISLNKWESNSPDSMKNLHIIKTEAK